MSDKNFMLEADWPFTRKGPPLPEPDVQASAEQLSNLAATRAFEKVSDEDLIPQPGEWHGRPAWFRKRNGKLEVFMGAGRPGEREPGWRVANPVAVPQQRGRGSSIETNALRAAVLRAAIALQKEWEPHLLTLEGGPALNPSAFLALMQATADYREATGE